MDEIKVDPPNIEQYVYVPRDKNQPEFIKALILLLKDDVYHIRSGEVEIGWVTKALKEFTPANYRITLKRAVVNQGELGTAFAEFFFERIPNYERRGESAK